MPSPGRQRVLVFEERRQFRVPVPSAPRMSASVNANPEPARNALGEAGLYVRVPEVVLRSRAGLDVLPGIVVPDRLLVCDLGSSRSSAWIGLIIGAIECVHKFLSSGAVSAAAVRSRDPLLLRASCSSSPRAPAASPPAVCVQLCLSLRLYSPVRLCACACACVRGATLRRPPNSAQSRAGSRAARAAPAQDGRCPCSRL